MLCFLPIILYIIITLFSKPIPTALSAGFWTLTPRSTRSTTRPPPDLLVPTDPPGPPSSDPPTTPTTSRTLCPTQQSSTGPSQPTTRPGLTNPGPLSTLSTSLGLPRSSRPPASTRPTTRQRTRSRASSTAPVCCLIYPDKCSFSSISQNGLLNREPFWLKTS